MTVINFIISVFLTVSLFFSSFSAVCGHKTVAKVLIDTEKTDGIIPNVVSNINVWDMGTSYYSITPYEEYNILDFVGYIQLMQCTGGTPERDLFKDPYDTSTMTDYDFERLINNCRGIVDAGAKPLLKLGGVPLKFTKDYVYSAFDMNLYPPDDYNVWYDYIKAIAEALVEEFGKDEVLSWRFSVLTEYENYEWFQARSGKPKDTATEYCKLYDYTAQALIDVLGEDVCIGAHSMTVTEGGWDERVFIRHCAKGTNYATGERGSHINYLSASYYDSAPGVKTSGLDISGTVKKLKRTAEFYGLTNLFYGIDEGRVLSGNNHGADAESLAARITGDTWQAAHDAMLYTNGINAGLDYFSSWNYLTGGNFRGVPTVSYHVSSLISQFAGSKKLAPVTAKASFNNDEVGVLSGYNEKDGKLYVMAYDFKYDIDYNAPAETQFEISAKEFVGKNVQITKYTINDDCNFFDEWRADRDKYNITDDCFSWSPDDPVIESITTLSAEWARELFLNELKPKYSENAKLENTTETQNIFVDGKITLNETINGNTVVFYVIEAV